ncbi:unnamed protein product [Pleuronectes platessa]|uniref:Uncharacterized protein n=1 Tax=Pleuronectes platessa TaxID=8262 RepID=A0A9N7YRF2_PLEPL|nr:unnamed protein product [Pleuronectes platessa]
MVSASSLPAQAAVCYRTALSASLSAAQSELGRGAGRGKCDAGFQPYTEARCSALRAALRAALSAALPCMVGTWHHISPSRSCAPPDMPPRPTGGAGPTV